MYQVKSGFEKTIVERMIPGFGQMRFELGKMTSDDVKKWIKRGAQIDEYFDEVDAGKAGKAAVDKNEKEAKEARFKMRVTGLLESGFKRVQDDFKREDGKVIDAKFVAESSDVEFAEFTDGLDAPVVPAAPVAPVVDAKVDTKVNATIDAKVDATKVVEPAKKVVKKTTAAAKK